MWSGLHLFYVCIQVAIAPPSALLLCGPAQTSVLCVTSQSNTSAAFGYPIQVPLSLYFLPSHRSHAPWRCIASIAGLACVVCCSVLLLNEVCYCHLRVLAGLETSLLSGMWASVTRLLLQTPPHWARSTLGFVYKVNVAERLPICALNGAPAAR